MSRGSIFGVVFHVGLSIVQECSAWFAWASASRSGRMSRGSHFVVVLDVGLSIGWKFAARPDCGFPWRGLGTCHQVTISESFLMLVHQSSGSA